MTHLPVLDSERPRERCLGSGPACLSLRECLALILGSGPPGVGALGLAERILSRPGAGMSERERERALFTALEVSPAPLLREVPGLGEAASARLLASLELGRRYANYRQSERTTGGRVSGRRGPGPAEASRAAIPDERRLDAQEWLGFVPWHRGGEMGDLCLVERGVRTHVNVDPAELFARVLALRPRGFVLAHNHPSGDPTPSECDRELTDRVAQVARQLGLSLLGHWVVSPGGDRWLSVV